MLFKEIEAKLRNELSIRGITSPYQIHEIIISILYLSFFDDGEVYFEKNDIELRYYASQKLELSKIDKKIVDSYKATFKKLDNNEIQQLISLLNFKLTDSNYVEMNNSFISKLSIKLLGLNDGDVLYDFGCSYGSFLSSANEYCKDNNIKLKMYFGCDLDINAVYISKMIMEILKVNYSISEGDYLSKELPIFSKGFVFPPLGSYVNKNGKSYSLLFPELTMSSNNQGWLFVDRMIPKCLHNENNKIVAIFGLGALFNSQADSYRKELLKSKYIEGIIELPSGMLHGAGIKLAVVVFSKNNDKVKIMNIEDKYNNKSLSINIDKNIDDIYKTYNNKEEDYYDVKQLLTLNTLLHSAASNKTIDIKDGRKLGEVADVFHGAQYTISKFKDYISLERTGRQIVVSSDIENGTVEWKSLPYVEGFDHFDKYQIHKGDLIVTSKSSKIKIAYVDVEPENKVLVTGGMLIIRPNKELDGTYLKIFLESIDGQKSLKSIQRGSIITSMKAKDLQDIIVPVPPIETQLDISKKYNNKLSTLLALKEEVKKIEDQLNDFYMKEVTEK